MSNNTKEKEPPPPKIQPDLFGINSYDITKNLKRTGKNSREVEYEFSGKDTKKAKSEGGVSKHVCVWTRSFNYYQGIDYHQLSCETEKAQKLKQEKKD